MKDETLIEPFAVPEIFVSGFSDHVIAEGIMTCAGYRIIPPSRLNGDPQKVVVVRLVFPAGAVDEAIADAKQAQSAPLYVRPEGRVGRH